MPPRLALGSPHSGRLRAMAGHHLPASRHLPAVQIGIRGHMDVVMSSHDAASAVDVTPLAAGP